MMRVTVGRAVMSALLAVGLAVSGAVGSGTSSAAVPEVVQAAQEADAIPGIERVTSTKGWRKVAQGVFVNTTVGDPSLVTGASKARPGRGVRIRVDEDARMHRVLRRGEMNFIDRSDDGRLRAPGSRVHDRGALMVIRPTGQSVPVLPLGSSVNSGDAQARSALVYIDTDARVNRNGGLAGGFSDFWRVDGVVIEVVVQIDEQVTLRPLVNPYDVSYIMNRGDRHMMTTDWFDADKVNADVGATISIAGVGGVPYRLTGKNPWNEPAQINGYTMSEGYTCYQNGASGNGLYQDLDPDRRYTMVLHRNTDTDKDKSYTATLVYTSSGQTSGLCFSDPH